MKFRLAAACLVVMSCSLPAAAEDGYDLWLRYRAELPSDQTLGQTVQELVRGSDSPTLSAAGAELLRGLSELTGRPIP
jgi:alpha-glucuronidase